MASLNKVMLIGNLGRDPEVRRTPGGEAVTSASMATTRSYKNKSSGERVEETEWHRLVVYGQLADIFGEHLRKGSRAYVEGRLKTRKWTDKSGQEKYVTEVVVEQLVMLGDASDKGRNSSSSEERPARAPSPAPAPRAAAPKTGTGFDDMDDDIPFS